MTATIAMSTWRNETPTAARTGSLRPPPDPCRRILARLPGSRGGPRRLLVASPPSVTPMPDSRIILAVRARRVLRAAASAAPRWPSAPGARRARAASAISRRSARGTATGPAADRLLRGVTELGSIWASVGAAAALARRATAGRPPEASPRRPSRGWRVRGSSACSAVLAPTTPAGRDALRIERPNGTSWPSSHPAVLQSFLTVTSGTWGGIGRRAALDALAAAVGVSRVYVGVHFPSDVAGGILLGKAVAAAFDGDRR